MSTRSIIRVSLDGEYRVCQYVQSDGYPEWRGVEVLKFTRQLLKDAREQEFRNRLSAAKTVLRPAYPQGRYDMAMGVSFRHVSETCTGAPTNSHRDAMLNKTWEARFLPTSDANPYGTRLRSWREAIEHLLGSGEITEKMAAWLAVAGRDSGIGALEWLMAHDTPMTFYMPEDLVKLPQGGGDTGTDLILGDYILDLDNRNVICGYHKFLSVVPFDDLILDSDEDIKARMERLEKEAWK